MRIHICLAIEPEYQIHLRDTKSAKEALDALKGQFAAESLLQKVRLRQKYYSATGSDDAFAASLVWNY